MIGNIKCTIERNTSPIVREDLHHPSLLLKSSKLWHGVDTASFNLLGKSFRKANYPELYAFMTKVDWSFLIDDVVLAVDNFSTNELFIENISIYENFKLNFPVSYKFNIINYIK